MERIPWKISPLLSSYRHNDHHRPSQAHFGHHIPNNGVLSRTRRPAQFEKYRTNEERFEGKLCFIICFILEKWCDFVLQLCYPLIDKILDSLNPQEDWDNFCDITNCSDILSCSERPTLKVNAQIDLLTRLATSNFLFSRPYWILSQKVWGPCLDVCESIRRRSRRQPTGGHWTMPSCFRFSFCARMIRATQELTFPSTCPSEVPKLPFVWFAGNSPSIQMSVYSAAQHPLSPNWKKKPNASGEQLSQHWSLRNLVGQQIFLQKLHWIPVYFRN